MARLLVDTGFLVALYRRNDRLHASAVEFLRANRTPLVTASPVIVETSFFLEPRSKAELLDWVTKGGVSVAEVPVEAYPALAVLLRKYRQLDLDFTDAALVWLAELLGEHRILTVDERDFAVLRLKGRKRFVLVRWHSAD